MEASSLQQMAKENLALEKQLTKKNTQYFHELNKKLAEAEIKESDKIQHLNKVLKQALEEQKRGVTARVLFGTVTEHIKQLVGEDLPKGHHDENDQPFFMWMDSALLLLAILGLMSGVMAFFANDKLSAYGVVTTLTMAGVGSGVFYLMYYFFYRYELPEYASSKRPKIWKIVLILFAAMFVWMGLYGVTLFLPAFINARLNAFVMIIIGGVALVGKIYLKQKLNIRSSMQRPMQHAK